MKELEKTKRISIAAVVTILVVIVALLSYKRPKHIYAVDSSATLEFLKSQDNFISLADLDGTMILIDIRNGYEFEKGHLKNAINMYSPELLNDVNTDILDDIKNKNEVIVLYGATPNEALVPFMLLHQLGHKNLKIGKFNLNYDQNELRIAPSKIENANHNIPEYIAASIKKAAAKPKPIIKKTPPPKKVVPKKKKKKMPIEGGC